MREFQHLLPPRVSHLDAQFLDSEVLDLLKSFMLKSVELVGVSFYTRLEPEIEALLKWVVYRLTLVRNRMTVGQQLLQMKYSKNVPRQTLARYALLLVFTPWLRKRAMDICRLCVKSQEKREQVFTWVNKIEVTYKVIHVINLLVFLHEGYYSTVEERFLKLRLVPTVPPHLRQISYSFFSRELLWNGFADLLTFVLPLIPAERFHRLLRSLLPSVMKKTQALREKAEKDAVFSPGVVCMVCGDPPVLPHQFGCQHLACYYCIACHRAKKQSIVCSLCGFEQTESAMVIPLRQKAKIVVN